MGLVFLLIFLYCLSQIPNKEKIIFWVVIGSCIITFCVNLPGVAITIVVVSSLFVYFSYLLQLPEKNRIRERSIKKMEQGNIRKKQIAERIKQENIEREQRKKDILKCDAVHIVSSNLYAIPLYIKDGNLVLLHPIFDGIRKIVKLSEITVAFTDIQTHINNNRSSAITQISQVAIDLHLYIEPQNRDLELKINKLRSLENLARSSTLYKQHADLYLKASNQLKELLNSGTTLSRECNAFIFDVFVGEELAKYDLNDFPDVLEIKMNLDTRCQQVSEEYKFLISEMDEYMNLKNGG